MRTLDEALRRCTQCSEEKPLSEFHPRPSRPAGVVSQCKKCDSKRAAEANKRRRGDPRWKEIWRRQRLRSTYGLSNEQIDSLEQVTECQACGRTAEQVGRSGPSGQRLHYDHDHTTGKVRGVLCAPCNSILGLAEDNVERLRALADYLEKP